MSPRTGRKRAAANRSLDAQSAAVPDQRAVAVREAPPIVVRDAVPADNDGLLDLAAACPMEGNIGLRIDRAPDFFALNRLEGDRWRVGVVDAGDHLVAGCVAVAERRSYLRGRPALTYYTGDLKVHPAHRGSRIADALTRYVQNACGAAGDDRAPILLTILAGNRRMERRVPGPRGLPAFRRFATIRSHAIPLLRLPRPAPAGYAVSVATEGDVEEMAALWARVAPNRQFAPVLDAGAFARWIDEAPALDLSAYRLARRRDGRLAALVGVWDQSSFKQLRVTAYSRRLAVARTAINMIAPVTGSPALPPAGGRLLHLTTIHVCASADEPAALRALLIHACREMRGRGFAFLTIGLDTRDPLRSALRGLLAQPTDIHAYITTPAGRYRGPALDDRPLHHEIALV